MTKTSTALSCNAATRHDDTWKSSANRHASNLHTINAYATAADNPSHG
jgi:hypothetical protein